MDRVFFFMIISLPGEGGGRVGNKAAVGDDKIIYPFSCVSVYLFISCIFPELFIPPHIICSARLLLLYVWMLLIRITFFKKVNI